MAYLKDIPKPRCGCGKAAVVTLYNNWNAANGNFCRPCGNRELRIANTREREAHERERAARDGG